MPGTPPSTRYSLECCIEIPCNRRVLCLRRPIPRVRWRLRSKVKITATQDKIARTCYASVGLQCEMGVHKIKCFGSYSLWISITSKFLDLWWGHTLSGLARMLTVCSSCTRGTSGLCIALPAVPSLPLPTFPGRSEPSNGLQLPPRSKTMPTQVLLPLAFHFEAKWHEGSRTIQALIPEDHDHNPAAQLKILCCHEEERRHHVLWR